MSFNYTSVNFDISDAFPRVETVRTMSNAMVERGELACTVLRVLDALEEGQGHTICFNYLGDLNGGPLNAVEQALDGGAGYVVAHREIARVKSVGGVDFQTLIQAIDDNAKHIATSDGVGLWSDPVTGELVLDAIRVYRYRPMAEAVGRDNKQYSIYDMITGEEIIL